MNNLGEYKIANRFFIKDDIPFVTSTEIEFELGNNTCNPKFKLDGDYIISGKDIAKILPKLNKNQILCETDVDDKTKIYSFASNSEIAELKESLKKQYDEKNNRLDSDYITYKREYDLQAKREINMFKEDTEYYKKIAKYLKDKIEEHNNYCIFNHNKIKINLNNIR